MKNRSLGPGDLVRVKTPLEILETLDSNGALDSLPFMPEMAEYSGQEFRVSKRILKTCISIGNSTTMRVFRTEDVFTLEGLRCSGAAHDGCQKGCMIFWREAWLRKAQERPAQSVSAPDQQTLRARLKTSIRPPAYFCQASELLQATLPLSRLGRLSGCVRDVRAGNCTAPEMVRRIAIWLYWRIRRILFGRYARGPNQATPTESLHLQAAELVEVKPIEGIIETLDANAHNRGLYFTPDMALLCGRRQRVERRLEKIIVDGTGEMRQMRNTVYLENSPCGCSHVALGGCPRGEFSYWREIWLRRPDNRS